MNEMAQDFFVANWYWFVPGLIVFWGLLEWLVARQERRKHQLWLNSLSDDEREEYFAEEREWVHAQARRARKQRLDREARQRKWHNYMIYSGDYDPHD